jgi:predicted nucleic acid-binding protein
MAGEIILDTGPLVAFLDGSDTSHDACEQFIWGCRRRLVTTEAVIAEAMHLLRRVPGGQQACLQLLVAGFATIVATSIPALERASILMAKYADIPMDYADATLVVLAEELNVRDVFTLDKRGFTVYRCARDQAFSIVP